MNSAQMRIRTIKPGFLSDEELWDLEDVTGIPGRIIDRAYIGLWMIADREGRFEWRPRVIGPLVLPFWEKGDISRVLDALATGGFIVRYASGTRKQGEKVYGFIPKFKAHQWINNKEFQSVLPPPPNQKTHSELDEVYATATRESREPHTPISNYYKGKGKNKTSTPLNNTKPVLFNGGNHKNATAKAKPPKPLKANTDTNPNVKTLIDYFHDSVKQKVSPEANVNCGQAAKVFKNRLAALPLEEIKQRVDSWFASTNSFIDHNKNNVGIFDQNFHILKRGPINDRQASRKPDPEHIANDSGSELNDIGEKIDLDHVPEM